jgi:hypothetical protein
MFGWMGPHSFELFVTCRLFLSETLFHSSWVTSWGSEAEEFLEGVRVPIYFVSFIYEPVCLDIPTEKLLSDDMIYNRDY